MAPFQPEDDGRPSASSRDAYEDALRRIRDTRIVTANRLKEVCAACRSCDHGMIGNSIASLAKSIQVLALVEDILGEIAAPALFAPVEEGNGTREQPQTLPESKYPIDIDKVASAAVLAQVLLYDSSQIMTAASTAATSEGSTATGIELAQPGMADAIENLPNGSPVTSEVRPLKDSCWCLYVALNNAQYIWENLYLAPNIFFPYLVIVATFIIRSLLWFYALASITAIRAIWTRRTLPSTMAVALAIAILLFGVGLFRLNGLLQKKLVGLRGSLHTLQKDVASLRTDVLNLILLYKRLLAAIGFALDAIELQEPPDDGTAQIARIRRILADKCLRARGADVLKACEDALGDLTFDVR
ncbi:hypothetical protein EV715DRAFT_296143 [Schizophyllum commune]